MTTRRQSLIVWIGLTLLVLLTQYRSGAYHADFTRDPDEPAHAVSSLAVHDYLTQAFPSNPVRFAHAFYDHYPKISIGHWPPLFYVLEGVWTLIFGRTRIVLLLFVGLCGVSLAASVYFTTRRWASRSVALFSIAVLGCSPLFQSLVCTVRPDLLLALLVFWAAIFMTQYMVTGRLSRLLSCLVLGVLALLAHGRAAVLLFLPFFVQLIDRRRFTWKWIVALGVLIFVVAWPHIAVPESHFTILIYLRLLYADIWRTALNLEWLPAVAGVVAILQLMKLSIRPAFWTTMACLAIATFCFNLSVPTAWGDDYLLVAALPAWAALAGYGAQELCARFAAGRGAEASRAQNVLAALAVLALIASPFLTGRKRDLGFHTLVASGELASAKTVLIAANGLNEGSLIAESSLADPDRSHTVLRGSKVLARSTWAGNRYQPRFASEPELKQYLDGADICVVMVQVDDDKKLHQQQLQALLQHDSAWTLVGSGPQLEGVKIYRSTNAQHCH